MLTSPRYLTLFSVFTPYTVHRCEARNVFGRMLITKACSDGIRGWGKLVLYDGWKCNHPTSITYSIIDISPDFLLAACDVEGSFLAVKVCFSLYVRSAAHIMSNKRSRGIWIHRSLILHASRRVRIQPFWLKMSYFRVIAGRSRSASSFVGYTCGPDITGRRY